METFLLVLVPPPFPLPPPPLFLNILAKKSAWQWAWVAVFSCVAEGDSCCSSHGESHFLEDAECSHFTVMVPQCSWDLRFLGQPWELWLHDNMYWCIWLPASWAFQYCTQDKPRVRVNKVLHKREREWELLNTTSSTICCHPQRSQGVKKTGPTGSATLYYWLKVGSHLLGEKELPCALLLRTLLLERWQWTVSFLSPLSAVEMTAFPLTADYRIFLLQGKGAVQRILPGGNPTQKKKLLQWFLCSSLWMFHVNCSTLPYLTFTWIFDSVE